MASHVKDTTWLEWVAGLIGTASRQTDTATLPPDRFHCLLDELPLHLIPRDFLRSKNARKILEQPLFLNPLCSIYPAGQWPEELTDREEFSAAFVRERPIAWVRDPATGALLPFWLGKKMEAVVKTLRLNEPAPSTLKADDRFKLAAAGILIPRAQTYPARSIWYDVMTRGATAFQEKGYVPLRHLIHPFHVAALRRYYRYQVRRGAFRLGDHGNPLRYVANNETVARFFHRQLNSTVSTVAGLPVKPSYVYFASYLSGAELTKHTDRPQCEFSITLCLDFSPEPACETSWPVQLETPRGAVAVHQALGDGLMYRGTRVPHYRSALPEGRTSTSIFFHYVAADFDGPLD
ncbi:MAG: hypothetical protein WB562_19830 [Candidatus Sulfotelmatobacter sp.]